MGVKIVSRPPLYGKALEEGIPATMHRAAEYLRSCAERRIKNGVQPPNSPLTISIKRGDKTLRDSDDLVRGIAVHSGATWADASTNKKQARLLQEGGTIRPKNARALWIPSGPNTRKKMKDYGAFSPGALIRAMKADGYTFFKKGKAFIAKKGKDVFMLFIIKDSVTIPARPFLHIDAKDEEFLTKLIQEGIRKEMGGKKQ
ncbi:MAG: phage virion morphogenesis protein [Treponema sp.]|jgi:phage gpG-like protein|nr:phage virion morphogenesis protein [Treponema sp.]